VLVVAAVVVLAGIVLSSAKATVTSDSDAIAKISLPLGSGTVDRVSVATGPNSRTVPVTVRGDRIYPIGLIPANETLSVQVFIKRPGYISWLAGKSYRVDYTVTTPAASLRSHFLTIRSTAPLQLHFKSPIEVYWTGQPGHMVRHVLAKPASVITLPRTADAGTAYIAAAPRQWESARMAMVDWFPPGADATAVANPAPGTTIRSNTPITLTFSKPVAKALGSHLPPVSPMTAGTWHVINSHAIVFRPEGYGYGIGAKVSIALPSGVRLVGGEAGDADTGNWTVPAGSTTRLQQVLAMLGYLPFDFHYTAGAGVATTLPAQEAAAVHAPAGRFSPRYGNTPSWLLADWQPGSYGELTKGAVMAFENSNGMTADGVAGSAVWQALLTALIHNQKNTFGYTVVDVSEGSPETETTWHNGQTVVSGAVNTGTAAAGGTAQGTFAVFEHVTVTTMTGTNPGGSHYSDPGIPDVSYFNGGDALHGYIRASYGFPQSDGCVEMPYSEAAAVYPFTPIGTIVHVV
jgi:peptidoglycan hydrolase-like protein with peptidoglycan-binding domain